MKRAVFLDRDGTINREVDFLSDPSEVELLPGASEAIARLNNGTWLVIVVTNQSGVGRGYFSKETVDSVHHKLQVLLTKDNARLDAVYYCPHHPDDGCKCRKPALGMLQQAVVDYDIDLQRSFVIGDKLSDVEMGKHAGCRSVLVLTGYGEKAKNEAKVKGVDFIAQDLPAAVNWILEERA
jgi:D-glycero-D-manno-heptose 1,7-bisphosphate phosphatase